MIGLDVLGIRLVSPEEPPVLLLQEQGGSRCLPIWIGNIEAAAIAVALEGEPPQRPMTHDLLASVVDLLGDGVGEAGAVRITRMHDGVYDAVLLVGGHEIPARPSDCVAIAVRLGWPMECPVALMDQVGVEVEESSTDEVEAFRAFLDTVNADDFEDE
ncbi:hypothetical protein BCR15_03535 [Tessaracoccus lapidicaptus]|uniref:Uncharacterized protein n=1 Tax=Tessaracoccus lapidicaptus TaxID=1427523 RepID=A0A1C0ANB1_9ACTN|nr:MULTISPECIES: bifunctional nuclease family protein [Tessaracoccus]AQX14578.1 hypothetical protein BKM78_00480 [Tessaracoccus sp. T2.5-30]OCL34764.1 hypothetical protein BCR15_03535 [Tessaracoccus lapidicaptus]VEP38612.1 hypothetical protein TLA_TLA_00098 [Tessaracoccus lapidicaptus]